MYIFYRIKNKKYFVRLILFVLLKLERNEQKNMKETNDNCPKKISNCAIDEKQLKEVVACIREYITGKGHTRIDIPILMERDVQDGVFIEDNKIFKTSTKSIRYDLTLPLFIYYNNKKNKEKTLSYTVGPVFRDEKEDCTHFCEFNQFEIDIFNPNSIYDDVCIGNYMKEIAKIFFDENMISLRINYRPLTEWLMALSRISNRQEFYNMLDLLDKEFSDEKCRDIFHENYDIAKRVLLSSTVEELEAIDDVPRNIVEYFRNYKALDDKCIIRPLLARGALYYDGVVYEMFHTKLGSAIMGGGHGTMFGVTRVGASFGLERLIICINS